MQKLRDQMAGALPFSAKKQSGHLGSFAGKNSGKLFQNTA